MKWKKWRVQVYQGHTGIVDGDGIAIASICGNKDADRTARTAQLIVRSVNSLKEKQR